MSLPVLSVLKFYHYRKISDHESSVFLHYIQSLMLLLSASIFIAASGAAQFIHSFLNVCHRQHAQLLALYLLSTLCRTPWNPDFIIMGFFLFWIYGIKWKLYCSSAAYCCHIAKGIYMPQCVTVGAWGCLGMLKDLQTVGIMLRQETNLVRSCPYCLRRVAGVC